LALKSRVFRLFVSSTFSDFIAEREALQKHVFPKLEDYCAKRGASFQAIDLRWGITEEAQRDRETIQICLEEVRRCQKLSPRPNFAILLSHRYGWEPVPERISENHWARLIAELEKQLDDTALETLKCVYRLDTNAVPPTYCLEPDQTQINEPEIQRILRCAAESFIGFDRLPYFGSATHQEIALGALGISDAEEHVHAYVRRIKNLPDDATAQAFIDWNHKAEQKVSGASDSLKKLESKLRDRLTEDQVHDFECFWNRGLQRITHHHLKRFCDDFYQHQVGLIDQELARLQQNQIEQKANEAHDSFARERSENFVGRKNILDQIEEYLHSPEDQITPLIAAGEGGAGKTSIIAQSYLNTFENPPPTNSPVVLCRFIGGVAGVESLKGLLESLISEIATTYGTEGKQTDPKMKSPSEAFGAALENATAEKPLWIFIDALDQLEQTDNLPLTEWLPELLPTYVRLVLSSRPEVLPAATHKSFSYIDINGMTQDEGDTLLSQWLASSRQLPLNTDAYSPCGRTLTPEQRRLLLESFKEHGNPLWLKLAYENARHWHSWDCPQRLPGTVAELVETFIETYLIEQRKHPPIFTRKALSYIAAGRYGLSEEEVTKALGTDPFVRVEFEEQEKTSTKWASKDSLPPILWSRLLLDLQPYLTSAFTDGALVYRYFHREFKETIKRLYLNSKQKNYIHAHLAEVFAKPDASDLYRQTDASGEHQDSRAMRRIMEQPWQLAKAGEREKLRTLLMDFAFCMAKCAANRSVDLVQDYSRAKEIKTSEPYDWNIWSGHVVGQIAPHLSRGDQSWPAHRIFLQLALEHADDSILTIDAEHWLSNNHIDWKGMHIGSRPTNAVFSKCISVFSGHKESISGVRVLPDNRFVSWSIDGTLGFWDAHTPSPVKIVEGHPRGVIDVMSLSTGSLLSYSDASTLKLWSANGCQLNVTDQSSHHIDKVLELSDRRLLSWSRLGDITLWTSSGELLRRLGGHSSAPEGAKELNDGRIVSWHDDRTIRIWSPTGDPLKTLKTQSLRVGGLIQLSDMRLLSWPGSISVHDFYTHSDDVSKLSLWSSDGDFLQDLAEGSSGIEILGIIGVLELRDGRILSWSFDTLSIRSSSSSYLAALEGHSKTIVGAMELSDGKILSWSHDNTLRLWSSKGDPLAVLRGHLDTVLGARELIDKRLLSWSSDGSLRIWSPDGKFLEALEGHTSKCNGATELSCGLLLSWSADKTIRIWQPTDNRLTQPVIKAPTTQEGHTLSIIGAKELSDGRLLTWSSDNTLRLWSSTGKALEALDGHKQRVKEPIELSDGRLLSWTNEDIRIWSSEGKFIDVLHEIFDDPERLSHELQQVTELPDGRIEAWTGDYELCWSPDGELLDNNELLDDD